MSVLRPWHRSQQELRFQVGEITLGRIRLNTLACEFGVAATESETELPPARPLDDGLHGFVLRGLPVDGLRPRFELMNGYFLYTPQQYRRYFVDLRQTFEEYAATFASKTRSTMRRKVRKFAEHSGGSLDFRTYHDPGDMREFHVLARRVSALTYQESLLGAGLPEGDEYLKQLEELAAEDRVRGFILAKDGRPVSYVLLTAVGDILVYDRLGFDPGLREWSIGTVLHWLALETLFSEGRFRLLDFTEGEGEQKRQFGSGEVFCANIYCMRNTHKLRALLRAHAGCEGFSSGLGGMAQKLGIHAQLRRFVRSLR